MASDQAPPACGQCCHYPRYIKAMLLRIEKMRNQPIRDRERMAEIAPW
ncbi:hypothetical protein CCP3SC15_6680002 [Gammaproteobacteria bacterium]